MGDDQFNTYVGDIKKQNNLDVAQKFTTALKQEGLTRPISSATWSGRCWSVRCNASRSMTRSA